MRKECLARGFPRPAFDSSAALSAIPCPFPGQPGGSRFAAYGSVLVSDSAVPDSVNALLAFLRRAFGSLISLEFETTRLAMANPNPKRNPRSGIPISRMSSPKSGMIAVEKISMVIDLLIAIPNSHTGEALYILPYSRPMGNRELLIE